MSAKAQLKLVVLMESEIRTASRLLHAWSELQRARRERSKGLPDDDAGRDLTDEEVHAAWDALRAAHVALYHVDVLSGSPIVVASDRDQQVTERAVEEPSDA